MDHQPIRRDQENLKEHKEVERVPRQKCPHNPHKLELIERVEMAASLIPIGYDNMIKHHQGQNRREQDHQRRKAIKHQNNAKRCGPIAEAIDKCLAARSHHKEANRKTQ